MSADLRTKCFGENISKGSRIYAYGIYELDNRNGISMSHTDRKLSKGDESAYRMYELGDYNKILYHTLIGKY